MQFHLQPHVLEMTVPNCNVSKHLLAEVLRICEINHACYFINMEESIQCKQSDQQGHTMLNNLVLKFNTFDLLKAKTISDSVSQLVATRGFGVEIVSMKPCDQFQPLFVRVTDYKKSGVCPEYTTTSSVRECHLSEDVKLRMIEDTNQSHVKVAPLAKKYYLVPKYKYKKYEEDPMNFIYLTYNLHLPMDNSEIRVHYSCGRSVSVPKMCFSLAKDEFPGQFENRTVSHMYHGQQQEMTEVSLVIIFRVTDEDFLLTVLDLLKPGSSRKGNRLVTSILIRQSDESVEDFEDFVRENKKYSMALWRKASQFDMDEEVNAEYFLQEQDLQEIDAIAEDEVAVKSTL